MAKFSLRRPDTQARVSLITSLASVVTLAGLIAVVIHETDFTERVVYYGWVANIAVLGATALTLMLSAVGFGLGLSSAGQRRNDKQKWSWIGFFVGAGVLCLTLIVFAFYLKGELVQ